MAKDSADTGVTETEAKVATETAQQRELKATLARGGHLLEPGDTSHLSDRRHAAHSTLPHDRA